MDRLDTVKVLFIEVVNHFPKRFRISSCPYRGAGASSRHPIRLTDPAFAGSVSPYHHRRSHAKFGYRLSPRLPSLVNQWPNLILIDTRERLHLGGR